MHQGLRCGSLRQGVEGSSVRHRAYGSIRPRLADRRLSFTLAVYQHELGDGCNRPLRLCLHRLVPDLPTDLEVEAPSAHVRPHHWIPDRVGNGELVAPDPWKRSREVHSGEKRPTQSDTVVHRQDVRYPISHGRLGRWRWYEGASAPQELPVDHQDLRHERANPHRNVASHQGAERAEKAFGLKGQENDEGGAPTPPYHPDVGVRHVQSKFYSFSSRANCTLSFLRVPFANMMVTARPSISTISPMPNWLERT